MVTPTTTTPGPPAATPFISASGRDGASKTDGSCGTRDHSTPSGEVHTAAAVTQPRYGRFVFLTNSSPTATRPLPAAVTLPMPDPPEPEGPSPLPKTVSS